MLPVRVLLADRSFPFARSAAAYLSAEEWIEVIGITVESAETVAQVAALRPDLVLLDPAMAGSDGPDLIHWIKSQPDPPRVVILTLMDDAPYRAAAEHAQADGFVGKRELHLRLMPLIAALCGPGASGDEREPGETAP
jgi:DNA-binding NarL/FixJ family response regulator